MSILETYAILSFDYESVILGVCIRTRRFVIRPECELSVEAFCNRRVLLFCFYVD